MSKEVGHVQKEPFIRISKRENLPWVKAWIIRLVAVILALAVCAVVIYVLTKMNPVAVYESIISGALGTARRTWVTIRDALILLCIAIAITPAFKMRFWNIGAEGQVLIGGLASAAVMIMLGNQLPHAVILPLMLLVSIVAGALWGMIPATFKAVYNTNETLFTLMMNYIAMQMVTFCIVFWENPEGSNSVGMINSATRVGWLPPLFGQTYGWNLVIVLLVTLGMHIYLKYSKQGYEIAVVGASENTARYAGINVKKTIIRTMGISGAVCGLAGFILISGCSHTISANTVGGRGFTAIIVAWMSKLNAFAMILVSFFLVFMERGAGEIASKYNLNENASAVLTGIILFFLLGCEFFISYKVNFPRRNKEEKA